MNLNISLPLDAGKKEASRQANTAISHLAQPRPGRPFALDDIKRREICALVAAGCSLDWAANFVGCSPNTIRRESRRNPQFGKRLREAAFAAQLQSFKVMREATRKNWRAAAWMLDRQGPTRSIRRRRIFLTGRQMRQLYIKLEAILSKESLADGPRERVLREFKQELFEWTSRA
jgi:hypothetical protein